MLPAYAGVILIPQIENRRPYGASRVCGGDPSSGISATITAVVLPAYAGVILALANEYQKYIGASRVCGGDPKPPIIK